MNVVQAPAPLTERSGSRSGLQECTEGLDILVSHVKEYEVEV